MPKNEIEEALKKAHQKKPALHTVKDIDREIEEKAIKRKATHNDMQYMNLHGFPLNPEMVGIIKKPEAIAAEVIVFSERNRILHLGVVHPSSKELAKVIKRLKKDDYGIEIFLISPSSLKEALKVYERVQKEEKREKRIKIELTKEELSSFREDIKDLKELETKIKRMPVTKSLDILVAGAIQAGASDIHLEPEDKETKLRYRIDGVLQDIVTLPKEAHAPVISRIKLLAKLKLNVIDIPQDGRFTINIGKKKVDVRVSILPSGYGETAVLRLLGMGATQLKLDDLGLSPRDYKKLQDEITKPNGMILTTGPTGSGKTTTLYSFLNQINSPEIKIITLENPIEYRLKGISQTQVEKDKGLDFPAGLRAILRQDPDVVMVGEIRDLETAETALNAALTGHLVFSTLHTNDAAGVIPRLIDMGARPFVMAPAINAVIAQRLVRKLCSECKDEYTADEETRKKVERIFAVVNSTAKLPEYKKLYRPHPDGCEKCHGTSYSGRIGIFEVFNIDMDMEKLIMAAATSAEIFEAAVIAGMTTMAQDGIMKAIEGITSVEEIDRVT
ncbi:GspE/PulE family protein [Patescibacteria group bacterium]